jgi:hypothetical protein
MTARISFRGWVVLSSIVFCIAVWWWLLSALFTHMADKRCQAKHPSAPEICRQAHGKDK